METDNALTVRNLRTVFHSGDGNPLPAVDGVDLTIPRGKIVGLVGESGCGKSVTALSLMGLVRQPGEVIEGEILFDGKNLRTLPERDWQKIRGNRIAMIFQDPMTSLNPVYPVGKQVMEALRLHTPCTRREAKAQTIALFRQVGLPDPEERFSVYPQSLSGGQRQRVMIAMAMACHPALLIADEPTTALDVTIQAQILRLMKGLTRTHETAILLITHNMGVVAQLCDEISVMYAGQIVERGETFALFRRPLHPYTLGLLEAIPSLEGERGVLHPIPGTVPDLRHLPSGCRFRERCPRALEKCAGETPPLREVAPGHWVRCFRCEPPEKHTPSA